MIIRTESYCSLTVFCGIPVTLSKAKIRIEIEISLFWPSQLEYTVCLLMEVVFQKILVTLPPANGLIILSAVYEREA